MGDVSRKMCKRNGVDGIRWNNVVDYDLNNMISFLQKKNKSWQK